MSNHIIEAASNRIRELEEEHQRLTNIIINLQIILRTSAANTRTQTNQRAEIERIGIRLIQITQELQHYYYIIEFEKHNQNRETN